MSENGPAGPGHDMNGPKMPPEDQSRASFDALLERCLPIVVGVVRRQLGSLLRSREESLDLAQSVCRQALEHAADFEFRTQEQFRAWLVTLVEHKIRDRYREVLAAKRDVRRERRIGPDENGAARDSGDLRAETSGPSSRAARRDESAVLREAIQALPEPLKEALRLHQLLGFSYEEVARRTGCTPKQARLRVQKAKLDLARALKLG